MASGAPSTFEELSDQLSVLQTRLIDEHNREVVQLQSRIRTLLGASGSVTPPYLPPRVRRLSSTPAILGSQPLASLPASLEVNRINSDNQTIIKPPPVEPPALPSERFERQISPQVSTTTDDAMKFPQTSFFAQVDSKQSTASDDAMQQKPVLPPGFLEAGDSYGTRSAPVNFCSRSLDDDRSVFTDDTSCLTPRHTNQQPWQCSEEAQQLWASNDVGPSSGVSPVSGSAAAAVLRRKMTQTEEEAMKSDLLETQSNVSSTSHHHARIVNNKRTGKVAKLASMKSMELEAKVFTNISNETFKIRELWDVSEKDLLRMKQKAIVKGGQAFPRSNKRRSSFVLVEEIRQEDWFVFHPHSRARLVWDIMAVCILLYDLIMVPMQVFDMPEYTILEVIMWMTVIYWTFDIGVSFVTGCVVDGHLEMRFVRISRRYLRTWFSLDLCVTCPEWIALVLEQAFSNVSDSVSLFRILRGSRFVRAVRFARLLRLLKLSKLLHGLDSRIRDDATILLLQISRLNLFIIVLAHLLACTWYAVGDKQHGWVYMERIAHKSLGDRYLYSFQWSLARLHPSNMTENMKLQTLSERVLAIFTTLLATVVLAVFVSTITTTMVEIKKHRKDLGWKVAVSRKYCREHLISEQLERRVKKFIDTETSRTKFKLNGSAFGICEAELMKLLPTSLLMDLRHEAWGPVISRMDFFASLQQQHKTTERDICHHTLREIPVFDGDTVFTTGDACSRMLFLVQGTLSYKLGCVMGTCDEIAPGDDEKVVPGQWVSEAVLWTPWENCGELKAVVGESTVVAIHVDEFLNVMRSHEFSMIDAAIYAKAFLEVLNHTDPEALTDVSKVSAEGRNSIIEDMRHSREEMDTVMPTLAW